MKGPVGEPNEARAGARMLRSIVGSLEQETKKRARRGTQLHWKGAPTPRGRRCGVNCPSSGTLLLPASARNRLGGPRSSLRGRRRERPEDHYPFPLRHSGLLTKCIHRCLLGPLKHRAGIIWLITTLDRQGDLVWMAPIAPLTVS
jgi:hypothetical protein